MKFKLTIFALLFSTYNVSLANFYAGGAITLDQPETTEGDISLLSANLRLGHEFSDNLAAEARIGFGISSDDLAFLSDDIPTSGSVKLENNYGLYGLAKLPITETLSPYLLLGYTQTNIKIEGFQTNVSNEAKGFTYGLGANLHITPRWFANIEYSTFEDEDTDFNRFSVGMSRFF